MKTRALLTTSILALSMIGQTSAWAQSNDDAAMSQDHAQAQVEPGVTEQTDATVDEKRAKLVDEAVTALEETVKALEALQNDDIDTAIASLSVATGKLETIVKRDPDLALAPVSVNQVTYDVVGSVQSIKDVANRVEDLVDDGQYQAARAMLRDFGSEIVVETVSLPLATYPDAILEAVALLDDGKKDEAITVLSTALSTQVVTEEVIPLPPLRAEAMIEIAKAMLEGTAQAEGIDVGDLTASDFVAAASEELQRAEALGYGRKRDYEDLYNALDDLQDKIKASQDTGGLLSTMSEKFATLRDRLFKSSSEK